MPAALPSLPGPSRPHALLQLLAASLLGQACAFAGDERLPAGEVLAFRLRLVRALHHHGTALAQVRGMLRVAGDGGSECPAARALGRLSPPQACAAAALRLQAGRAAAAQPLLNAAYETLTQLDLEGAKDGAGDAAALAAEATATGAQASGGTGVQYALRHSAPLYCGLAPP